MNETSEGPTEDLRFGDAMEELEEILRRVETEETDIDELARELRRATELVEVCRGKIRKAEVEVRQIVQVLDDNDSALEDADEESA